jgi:hypothetical protein
MDIESSSLWREVQAIIESGSNPVHHTWDITIYAGDETIKPFKVMSIDIDRDYLHNFTDYMLIDVRIPLGTYAKRLYPNANNVEIELKRIALGESSDVTNLDDQVQMERYAAVMIDTGNPVVANSIGSITSEEDLNRIDIPTVKFQLFNKALDQLRTVPAGGIYRNMTGEDVVKAVLIKTAEIVKVDATRAVRGVQMVQASNREKREHVIVPHQVKAVDIPHHVHYHCGGLYSAGLGYYLQDDTWYVFPAYDTTRFNDGDPTLTIVNIPSHRLPGIERTYRKDGDNLVVLATGQVNMRELRNIAQLNHGNGVRFADADALIDNFVQVKDNKAVAQRAKTNTEILADKRPNDVNYVTAGQRRINANPFVEYSALAARQGSGMSLVWENADPALVYPGMPVKVMYLDGDAIEELTGVLLGAHWYTSLRDPGVTALRFSSQLTLSVFVTPVTDTSGST